MGTASVLTASIRLRDVFTAPLRVATMGLRHFSREAITAGRSAFLLSRQIRSLARASADLAIKRMLGQLSGFRPYINALKQIYGLWVKIRKVALIGVGYGVLGAMGGVAAGMAAVTAIGVRFNAQMEQNELAFTQFLGSAVKAKKYLADLYQLASKTPFEFPELTQAARSLMSFGFSAQMARKTLGAVGDAVAAFGGGAEQIQKIVFALGQIKAKGVPQAEELMQLAEAGIPAYKILSKQLGLTGVEVANIGKSGISSQRVIDALLKGMNERFAGMATKQAGTLTGLWSTLKDTFTKTAGSITKSLMPALKTITSRLIVFAEWVDKVFSGKGSVSDKISIVWDRLKLSFDKWYQKNGDALFRTWGHRIGGGLAKFLTGSTHGSIGRAFWNMGKAGVQALASGFLANMDALKVMFSPLGMFIGANLAVSFGPRMLMTALKMFLTHLAFRRLSRLSGGITGAIRHPVQAAQQIATGMMPVGVRALEALPAGAGVPTLMHLSERRQRGLATKIPYPGLGATAAQQERHMAAIMGGAYSPRGVAARAEAARGFAAPGLPGPIAGRPYAPGMMFEMAGGGAPVPVTGVSKLTDLNIPGIPGAYRDESRRLPFTRTRRALRAGGKTARLASRTMGRVGQFGGRGGAAAATMGGLGILTTMLSGGFGENKALGMASTAMTGAAMGSMAGPQGMLIGGIAGAVVGGIAAVFFGSKGRQGILVKTAKDDPLSARMQQIHEAQQSQAKQNQTDIQRWTSEAASGVTGFGFIAGQGKPKPMEVRFADQAAKSLADRWRTNAKVVREQMEAGALAIGAAVDPKNLAPFVKAMTYYLEAARALSPAKRQGPLDEAARRAGLKGLDQMLHPGPGRGLSQTPFYAQEQTVAATVAQLKGLSPELRNRGGQRRAFEAMIPGLKASKAQFGITSMPDFIAQVEANFLGGLGMPGYLASRGKQDYAKTAAQKRTAAQQKALLAQRRTVFGATANLALGSTAGLEPGRTLKGVTPGLVPAMAPILRRELTAIVAGGVGTGPGESTAGRVAAAERWLAALNASTDVLKKTKWQAPEAAAMGPGSRGEARPGEKVPKDGKTAAEKMIAEWSKAVDEGGPKMVTATEAAAKVAASALSSGKVIDEATKGAIKVMDAYKGEFAKGLGALGIDILASRPYQPGAPPAGKPDGDFGRNSSLASAATNAGLGAVGQANTFFSKLFPPGGLAADKAAAFLGATDSTGGMPGGVGGTWGGTMPIILGLARGTGLPITSQKRPRRLTASGGVSDHWTGSLSAYATDLGVTDRRVGDPIAASLAAAVGSSWTPGQWTSATAGGYRFQVGWQVPDHFDHIHLGARKLHGGGQYRAPSAGGEGYALLRDRERVMPASASNPPGTGRPIIINYHGSEAGPPDVKKIAGELAGMIDSAARNYSSIGRRIDE